MRAVLLMLLLTLDPAFVKATVESIGATIGQEYFDPKVGTEVDAALRRSLADGRYAGAADDQALATLINRDLYAATRDKHLNVEARLDIPAQRERSVSQADEARALAVRRSNGGVRAVQVLPGNVGYLDLSSFYRPEEAREAIGAAMHLLAQTDALIIDMRFNSGGSPGTAALVISYLIDPPGLPLFDIVHRAPMPPDHYATETVPRGDRNLTRPVFVLTAARSFSAAEGFPFLLQERRRAEVIGEVTAGAANAGRPYRVNARFSVTIPNGQVKSAVGGGNWEGPGVTPDVKTAAADALKVAHARALRGLIDREPPGAWKDTLEHALRTVEDR
jgi:C-terminal processing protease CtpA/Prc